MKAVLEAGELQELPIRSPRGPTKTFAFRFHRDPRDPDILRRNRSELLHLPADNDGVLVIYSGGTIGSAPKDPEDPKSPQVVKPWPELATQIPSLSADTPDAINFRIDAVAFETPLDSSNMGPTEWIAVATFLKRYMDSYEGFVIAHGTDTMVYSASALSFMLENLKKPVILTGSQLSAIGHVRNDAQQNLITAILIANPRYSQIPNVPEVCIFFRDHLLRGNRALKIDASGYTAYTTPNFPPLGTAGASISIRDELLISRADRAFTVNERLDTNVMDVVVFPGIQETSLLQSVLETGGLRAVILRTFGAGNTPTNPEFLQQLNVARDRGIVVVNVTQCAQGSVEMGLYETSAVLMKYGVISGVDSTPVAALTKLMVLLGDERLAPEEVARRAQENLQGEQSESILVTPMRTEGRVVLRPDRRTHWFLTDENIRPLDKSLFRHASLILHSATVSTDGGDRLNVNVYLNVSSDEDLGEDHPKLACSVSRLPLDDGTLVFDVSNAIRLHLDENRKNSITVELAAEAGRLEWASAELALYTRAPSGPA